MSKVEEPVSAKETALGCLGLVIIGFGIATAITFCGKPETAEDAARDAHSTAVNRALLECQLFIKRESLNSDKAEVPYTTNQYDAHLNKFLFHWDKGSSGIKLMNTYGAEIEHDGVCEGKLEPLQIESVRVGPVTLLGK